MSRPTRLHPGDLIFCEFPVRRKQPRQARSKMAANGEGHLEPDNFPPEDPPVEPPQQNQDQLVELLQKLLTLNKNTETQGLANIANICKNCKLAQDADLFIRYTNWYTKIVASAFKSMANQLFQQLALQKLNEQTMPNFSAYISEFQLPQSTENSYENRGRQRGWGNSKSREIGRGGDSNQGSSLKNFSDGSPPRGEQHKVKETSRVIKKNSTAATTHRTIIGRDPAHISRGGPQPPIQTEMGRETKFSF